jgi:hypothetical protein
VVEEDHGVEFGAVGAGTLTRKRPAPRSHRPKRLPQLSAPGSTGPQVSRIVFADLEEALDEFLIGDTNFGVEREKSRFDLTKAADGRLLLTIEIRGNEKIYDDLSAADDSEWSWTLYPPYFYLRDYPVPETSDGNNVAIKLKAEDSDEFDLAIYLMEHFDVEGVAINVCGDRIEISGRVNLTDEPRPFSIKWTK